MQIGEIKQNLRDFFGIEPSNASILMQHLHDYLTYPVKLNLVPTGLPWPLT